MAKTATAPESLLVDFFDPRFRGPLACSMEISDPTPLAEVLAHLSICVADPAHTMVTGFLRWTAAPVFPVDASPL